MTTDEVITQILDEDELVRVDALAQSRGISRTRMFITCIHSGIATCEREDGLAGSKHEDAPPISQARPKA
jgi:hypothetical protein